MSPFACLTKGLACLLFAVSLLSCTQADAGVMYDFREALPGGGEGPVLATLTLEPDPLFAPDRVYTEISQFQLLCFTEAGRLAFGSSTPIDDYLEVGASPAQNRFKTFDGELIYERDMNLFSDNIFDDSTVITGETKNTLGNYTPNLTLAFTGEDSSVFSSIQYGTEIVSVTKFGRWTVVSVPEPTSIALWGCFAALGMGGSLRRKRRKK
jgi:hypothetical protein